MSDFERYGDYNDYDEPKKSTGIGLLLKLVIIFACISVAFVLGFRIYLFNHYPRSVKNIYFTEELTEYYYKTNGNIEALSQDYPYMYDDPEDGNFFGGNVIVIPGAGEIQFSIRYNKSLFADLEKKYGVSLDNDSEKFIFTLERNPGDSEEDIDAIPIGVLKHNGIEKKVMYRYHKLVFGEIDFGEGDDKIAWLRVRITIDGVDLGKDEYLVPVYQNHSEYNKFDDYKLSKNEVPEK